MSVVVQVLAYPVGAMAVVTVFLIWIRNHPRIRHGNDDADTGGSWADFDSGGGD